MDIGLVESQSTSCPSSVIQAAAIEALNGWQDFVRDCRRSFQERRDLVVGALNGIEDITEVRPGLNSADPHFKNFW